MKEEDKHKTAFVYHYGLYHYRLLPFGLTNVPTTFQHLIDTESLIASSSTEEHKEHVSRVLEKLTDTGLRLTPEKCCFAKTEISIEYLGYTLTHHKESNLTAQRLKLLWNSHNPRISAC